MAVLVEAITVIIRRDRLPPSLSHLDPARSSIWAAVSFCTDGELVRIGFRSVPEAEQCIGTLTEAGLEYVRGGEARDFVIVDQTGGPSVHGDWFKVSPMIMDGHELLACRMKGSGTLSVATAAGWTYEGSVTDAYNQLPLRARQQMLRLVRRHDGQHVYRHPATGRRWVSDGWSKS